MTDWVAIIEIGTILIGVVVSVVVFMGKVNRDHRDMQDSLKEIVARCVVSNNKCMSTMEKITDRLLNK